MLNTMILSKLGFSLRLIGDLFVPLDKVAPRAWIF